MCGIILIFVQSIFRMTVRSALETDLGQIMAVLDAAKGIMRADGNDRQWVGGYPSEAVILEDIRQGYGQVVLENGRVVEEGTVYDIFANPREEITRKFVASSSLLGRLPQYLYAAPMLNICCARFYNELIEARTGRATE